MNNKQIAIRFQNVSKTFHFRDRSEDTIRQKVRAVFSGENKRRRLTALQDVSLEINRGDFVGIVGHNGSGKSTFLKLVIGALRPDRGGVIQTNGRVLRLSLGMGFDKELSARDNVFLNGSVIGLSRRRIAERFDHIIDFAGLGDFVDTPVKLYSSGMVSRLAFSLALQVEADILLIDEFFVGVGDKDFQVKSREAFRGFLNSGKTILFVSHELEQLREFADKVILFEKGRVKTFGDAAEVFEQYKPKTTPTPWNDGNAK